MFTSESVCVTNQFGELPFHHLFIIHLRPTGPGCLDLVTPAAESIEHNWLIIAEPGECEYNNTGLFLVCTYEAGDNAFDVSYFICIHQCNLYSLIALACRQLDAFVVQSILSNSVSHFPVYLREIAKRVQRFQNARKITNAVPMFYLLTHLLN